MDTLDNTNWESCCHRSTLGGSLEASDLPTVLAALRSGNALIREAALGALKPYPFLGRP